MAIVFLLPLSAFAQVRPATVLITAGQSNTDGRVPNTLLPETIKHSGYTYCRWLYGSGNGFETNGFEPFYPRTARKKEPCSWAYDAVTYYWLEQYLKSDFYVIKWSLGGTAIDPTAPDSNGGKYWSANHQWLEQQQSTIHGGKSLLYSLIEAIDSCVDGELSKLPDGFRIKAFLWHQGEGDSSRGTQYKENLREVVRYVRNYLVKKTGCEAYRSLPFLCGTVSRRSRQYNKDVETALWELSVEEKAFYVVDMSDGELQSDQLHFTATSAEKLGKAFFDKMIELHLWDE